MTNWKTTDFQSVNINYSNKAEGKYLISLRDDFVNGLSPFDLEARCGFKGATIWDYLLLCRDSVLDWTENEISMLEGLFWEIGSELKRHGMAIPSVETINPNRSLENFAFFLSMNRIEKAYCVSIQMLLRWYNLL